MPQSHKRKGRRMVGYNEEEGAHTTSYARRKMIKRMLVLITGFCLQVSNA